MDKITGTVKWFSRVRGYGFIQPDDGTEDVFVHFSAIEGEGYRNLYEDERVRFRMEDTPKGPQAVDVTRIVADDGEEEPTATWPEDVAAEEVPAPTPSAADAADEDEAAGTWSEEDIAGEEEPEDAWPDDVDVEVEPVAPDEDIELDWSEDEDPPAEEEPDF